MAHVNKFVRFCKKLGKSIGIAVKGEIDELRDIQPTEEDYEQGAKLAVLCTSALAACGIPIASLSTTILAKALAYGLRNLKDGIEDNNKLIIQRILTEMKRS